MMTVTCSILCHNYGRFLVQAIESCLKQNPFWCKLEVLVINDGSTDNTEEICSRYGSAIRAIHSENQGFGASLNRAVSEASGSYICLLDADDYFASDKFDKIHYWIKKGYYYIANSVYLLRRDTQPSDAPVGGPGSTSTLCLHREAALTLLPVENEISFSPLREAGHGIALSEPLTYYRVHNDSMMRKDGHVVWYRKLASVTHALATKLDKQANLPPFWCTALMLRKISQRYRAIAYYDEMEAELLEGNWIKAVAKIPLLLWYFQPSGGEHRFWHMRVALRCLRNKPIRCEGE